MYIPSQNFSEPQECEIVCPWTGESYVYVDSEKLKNLNQETLNGALELLPERFFKRPIPLRCPDGQVKIHFRL